MSNKFSFLLQQQIETPKDLEEKILKSLNSYLQFTTCELLLKDTDAVIFGGAVRDSIAELEIHDLDILALPDSCSKICMKLDSISFKKLEKFNMDIATAYKNSTINEPYTFYKENTFVQIIRPRLPYASKQTLLSFVEQVDISCCGVCFIVPQNKLAQCVSNAIKDCQLKQFRVNKNGAFLNNDRIDHRINKLERRGWKHIDREIWMQTKFGERSINCKVSGYTGLIGVTGIQGNY
jgi:hypothetical protein